MCSGAMQRNKAPYWVHRTWVNVRLEHMQQETEKKGGGGTKERRKAIKRSRGGGEMRWRAKVESFIMACALYCAISSSI